MLDCHSNLPARPRRPPSISREVWVFRLKLTKCIHSDPLVDVRRSEAVCNPPKDGEYGRQPVLKSEMQGVIRFDIVEWDCLCIKRAARRGRIELIAGRHAGYFPGGRTMINLWSAERRGSAAHRCPSIVA